MNNLKTKLLYCLEKKTPNVANFYKTFVALSIFYMVWIWLRFEGFGMPSFETTDAGWKKLKYQEHCLKGLLLQTIYWTGTGYLKKSHLNIKS